MASRVDAAGEEIELLCHAAATSAVPRASAAATPAVACPSSAYQATGALAAVPTTLDHVRVGGVGDDQPILRHARHELAKRGEVAVERR